MKTKTDSELVLEFCIELSRRMIVSGANLERVQMVSSYSVNCLLTLLGMSIGFVLSSIVAHYIRKMRFSALRKVSVSVEEITEIEESPFHKGEFGDEDT